jgi:hypothetical protein
MLDFYKGERGFRLKDLHDSNSRGESFRVRLAMQAWDEKEGK